MVCRLALLGMLGMHVMPAVLIVGRGLVRHLGMVMYRCSHHSSLSFVDICCL
jgi:hypothetical protein